MNGLLGLIASIIEACEQRALPAEAQYEEFLSRSLDFIVNDVFTGFDTWRYRDRLARWRIGEEVLLLIYKLLQFASPSAMEEPANKQTVVTGRALLVRLGDRIALHLLSSPALQMTVLKPIVVERMFLESGHPQVGDSFVKSILLLFAFNRIVRFSPRVLKAVLRTSIVLRSMCWR